MLLNIATGLTSFVFKQISTIILISLLGGKAAFGDYKVALDESSKIKGARLIDVWVDPDGYADQLKSLRG